MRGLMRNILCAGIVVALALTAGTAEAAKEKKKPNGAANPAFAIPKEITLTADQQTKLDAIKKEEGPKLVALTEKLDAVLTEEQKTARKEAAAKAKADGKKGKDASAAVDEALKLTDEQKKQRAEIQPQVAKLQLTIKEQIHGLLTDEQKAHYKLPKAKKAK